MLLGEGAELEFKGRNAFFQHINPLPQRRGRVWIMVRIAHFSSPVD